MNTLIFIVSTLFTFIMGKLSKKWGWNEDLPIPIQNIFVALIVWGICYLTMKPSNPVELFNQIWLALGGAGTAALVYDATKKE